MRLSMSGATTQRLLRRNIFRLRQGVSRNSVSTSHGLGTTALRRGSSTPQGWVKDSPVQAFLVTGNPGSGKSTVAAELARRGYVALDPDYDPELSHWRDSDGLRTDLDDGPAAPTEDWLRSHRWVWSRPRLEELLASSDAPVFVCGIAVNQHELVDLFAKVFLLRIDDRAKKTGSSGTISRTRRAAAKRAGGKSGRGAQCSRPRCFSSAQPLWTARFRLGPSWTISAPTSPL